MGKIQERCCHGLSASSASQRAIVEADAAQTPRSITSRCSSAREKRESGTPSVRGSSQAIAFTCATSSGGKTPRTARPWSIARPSSRSSKKRFRHNDTVRSAQSRRRAISAFVFPSAASSTIFARNTSPCGVV